MVLLLLQDLLDDLGPGHFLGHWLVGLFWRWQVLLSTELRALFIEALLKDLHSQSLVHPNSAYSTLVAAAVWCPSMMWCLPRFAASGNELLLVLFCVSALMPVRLLVDVVLFVLVDFLQAVDGMGIDEVMIII